MIAIVNVDKNFRESGPHEYELRINRKVILKFTHNREEGLAKCLKRASMAMRRKEREELVLFEETFFYGNSD